jgi:hypothetical protein
MWGKDVMDFTGGIAFDMERRFLKFGIDVFHRFEAIALKGREFRPTDFLVGSAREYKASFGLMAT